MPDGWSYAQNNVNTKNGDAQATARADTNHLDCVQADYRCSRRASWEHFHEVWEQSAQGFTEADYRRETTRQTGWSVCTSTRHTDMCLMDGRTGKVTTPQPWTRLRVTRAVLGITRDSTTQHTAV